MKDSRELAAGFDNAVDQAMANLGAPEEATEPEAAADDGTRDASAPALRALTDDDAAPVETPAAPSQASDPRTERAIARAQKYAEFLDDIENNPALRKHVEGFWDPPQDGPKQSVEEDDPLAEYDERDKSALTKLLERQEKKLRAEFDAALAPFREQMAVQHASQEFAVLDKEHPDWKTHASKEDLAAVRKEYPGLTLTAAYRLVGLPKELAAVRGHVTNAGRQMAKVSEVLSRKHPAESTPRRHVKVEKREVNYDEAFELAYAKKKAAFGQPGR